MASIIRYGGDKKHPAGYKGVRVVVRDRARYFADASYPGPGGRAKQEADIQHFIDNPPPDFEADRLELFDKKLNYATHRRASAVHALFNVRHLSFSPSFRRDTFKPSLKYVCTYQSKTIMSICRTVNSRERYEKALNVILNKKASFEAVENRAHWVAFWRSQCPDYETFYRVANESYPNVFVWKD